MIGLFGGTFDPVHFGHLRVALDCQQALGLDELRLLPLRVAVHRPQPVASAAHRLAMLEAAVAGEPHLRVDDRELGRDGPSYTVETLESLRAELGGERPLCVLIGADAFNGFMDWHRPRDILGLAHVVVMQRPGAPTSRDVELRDEVHRRRADAPAELRQTPAGRIWFQTVTQLDISSTRIRRMLAAGLSPRYLLPDAVLDLARHAGCYNSATVAPQPGDPPPSNP